MGHHKKKLTRRVEKVAKRPRRKEHCGNKIRYQSKAIAESVLRGLLETGVAGVAASAYKCTFCRSWHWGHASRKTRT